MEKFDIDRMKRGIKTILVDSGKTDLDSQIECMESLRDNLIRSPQFISIIASLRELRAIKKGQIPVK